MKRILGLVAIAMIGANVAQATTIRIDLTGADTPDGFVPWKAATADAGTRGTTEQGAWGNPTAFGSIGVNAWNNVNVSGNTTIMTGLRDTSTGNASSIGVTLSGTYSAAGDAGDWRAVAQNPVSGPLLSGIVYFGSELSFAVSGLTPLLSTTIWIEGWDGQQRDLSAVGSTSATTSFTDTYGGNIIFKDQSNNPQIDSGWGVTVLADAFGVVTGTYGTGKNDVRLGGFQIYQAGGGNQDPVPEPGTWLLLGGSLLGLCAGGFRRFVRK